MPEKLHLISHALCPYVQRAVIALTEKGVPFERSVVDLDNKPDWFLAVSPLGRVPVLVVGETPIFESAVIVEYLEETQPNPLHPADPLERARHRGWIEMSSAILADLWAIETTASEAEWSSRLAQFKTKFARVEEALGEGPFFAGKRFSLVDAAFGPAFRYFDTFDNFIDLGVFDGLPKVAAWRRTLSAHPSVANAVGADYGARLEAFLRSRPSHFASLMVQAA